MHPKQAVAAALAVCVGAMWLAIDVPDEADCSDPAGIEVRTAPRIAQPPVDLDAPGGIPDRRPCAEETSRRPADPPPQPLDSLQPGGLILGAIDRETGRPLDAFTVRLASATRFAEENLQSGQGVIDILLTPDTYEGLVMAPGYEPVLLAPVAVGSGAIVRLGPVALLPGCGSVRVAATGTASYDGLSVELRGVGRRPCERCAGNPPSASPCASCGFAESGSSLRLGSDGRADFTGLAHGIFLLRVVEARGRTLGDEERVDLAPGASAIVLFDLSQSRTVELELLDSDGVSLSTEWSRRLAALLAAQPAEEQEIVSFEEGTFERIPIQIEIRRDTAPIAWGAFLPPSPPGDVSFTSIGIGCAIGLRAPPRLTADRERGSGDSLWPEAAVPRFEPSEVACELDQDGIAILAPLSTSQLEIHLTAKDLAADAIVPAGRGPTRVRAQLRSPPSSTGDSADPPVTYLALERRRDR